MNRSSVTNESESPDRINIEPSSQRPSEIRIATLTRCLIRKQRIKSRLGVQPHPFLNRLYRVAGTLQVTIKSIT